MTKNASIKTFVLAFIMVLCVVTLIFVPSLMRPQMPTAYADEIATKQEAVVKNNLKTRDQLTWTQHIFGESTLISTGKEITKSGDFASGITLGATGLAGKFTTGGHDGINFYATKLNGGTQDFYIQATVKVDQIGKTDGTIDGQEGFAVMARNSVGTGTSIDGAYSNSISAIATKITYKTSTGGNVDIKDGIGTRLVTGISSADETPTVGTFSTTYKEFDREIMVTNNSVYTFSIEKINSKYIVKYHRNAVVTTIEYIYPTFVEKTDKLLGINNDIYIGFAVARNCIATFSNVVAETYDKSTEPIDVPIESVPATFELNELTSSTSSKYVLQYVANQPGSLSLKINDEDYAGLQNVDIQKDVRLIQEITLPAQVNELQAIFTPDTSYSPGVGMEMSKTSIDVRRLTVTVGKYGKTGEILVVSPTGTDSGAGTSASPLSLSHAVRFLQAGQTIVLKQGTYEMPNGLLIERGNDGTEDAMKRIVADPMASTRPIIDCKNGLGVVLKGNYWHLKGFDITNTKDKEKGLTVWGNNNILDLLETYKNGNTGLQISGSTMEPRDLWPSNNLIINCTSYQNCDADFGDADGFAIKLTSGDGNVIRGCIAYENADDGYDLYSKPENGTIGVVKIYNSVAYRNGHVPGIVGKGNGNGFKLGGSNMSGKHEIYNSISFQNDKKGIESNSCPDIKVFNCTSVDNLTQNFRLYTNTKATTSYVIEGALSFKTDWSKVDDDGNRSASGKWQGDSFVLNGQSENDDIKSANNFFHSGSKSVNKGNVEAKASWFESLESPEVIGRDANGAIDMKGYLQLTTIAMIERPNTGARLQPEQGPEVTLGNEVDGSGFVGGGGNGDGNGNGNGNGGKKGCGAISSQDAGIGGFMGLFVCFAYAVVCMVARKGKNKTVNA